MNVPLSDNLDTAKLSSIFNNTSATYKYYWFLALLDACEQGNTVVAKKELFSSMLANAWFTVNYFQVSFGSQDLIQQSIKAIAAIEKIPIQIKKDVLQHLLVNSENAITNTLLRHFDKNVPHWFLTPWLNRNKGESDSGYRNSIYTQSQNFNNQSLYALYPDRIEINPSWIDYLQKNAGVLRGYCYWHLSNFLQVRNPNIPDIPGKLIKPPLRGSLLNQRRNYWDIVLNELGSVDCIYTDTKLTSARYALDHFVPHAFVSHDLIWNLAPIDVSFNSIKSDKLPSMELHFDKFYQTQKKAFELISYLTPKNKLLQDYVNLFNDGQQEMKFEYHKFRKTIAPLVTIAGNNGFSTMMSD